MSVPVGEQLIGRVVNAVGKAIDGGEEIKSKEFYPVERIAPGGGDGFTDLVLHCGEGAVLVMVQTTKDEITVYRRLVERE